MSNTKSHPPSILLRFFRWFCHPDLAIYIEGDLIELFEERVDSRGGRKAKWLFAFDVVRLIRPDIIRPVSGFQRLNQYGMFQNHVKSAWRNLLKRKRFSALNIAGLSIGMASCLLILQFIRFEMSYDQFHPNIENLYRLTLEMNDNGSSGANIMSTNHPAAGPNIVADYPQVEDFTRLVTTTNLGGASTFTYVTSDQQIKAFQEEKVFLTDTSFFKMFNFPLVKGNPETALQDPKSIIISESLARKYFGDEEPLGKMMVWNSISNRKVTGVLRNLPENSHLKIDVLMPLTTLLVYVPNINSAWKWPEFHTYVKLAPQADVEGLAHQMDDFVNKYLGDINKEHGLEQRMHLQPVADIHLHSNHKKELEENGSYQVITFLSLIVLMILLIAWINYVNLSTSRSIERANEVGIRKVVGANKGNLISQFFIESAMINLMAISMALVLVDVATPGFNSLMGKQFFQGITSINFWTQSSNWMILAATLIGGSLLAGLYPALVLSSFKPIKIFNGYRSREKLDFRSVLVIFQFCVTFMLIVGTLIVFNQLNFMQNKSLGFNLDQVVVVKSPRNQDSTYHIKTKLLKEQLLRKKDIHQFSISSDTPGHLARITSWVKRSEQSKEDIVMVDFYSTDEQYLPTYGIELVAGRNFSKDLISDQDAVLLNEKAVELLGYQSSEDALGKMMSLMKRDVEIIGVTRNINGQSLEYEQQPMVFPNIGKEGALFYNYYNLKISAENIHETLSSTEDVFKEIFPKIGFEYFFIDDHFNQQYKADQQFGKIFGVFTSLAIFVACLGLFGLVSYVSSTRTKEIGIRKVMGASTMQILTLLSKQFVKLLIIAAILAVPISWWGGDTWLDNYAYRIEIDWTLFVGATLIVFSIALFTVLWQSISTANANPVDSLRDE
jgi:putative ABC transport system permease protein